VIKARNLMFVMLLMSVAGVSTAADKIAVIDVQRAIMETNVAQKRLKAMNNERDYKDNMRDAEKIKSEGEALVAKLKKDGPVMGASQKADLQKRIQEKQADLEHIGRKVQATQKQVMQELMMELQGQAKEALDKIIKSERIGLLLDSRGALHAEPSYDITAKVTKKLNDLK
jgi:outer membrane protein